MTDVYTHYRDVPQDDPPTSEGDDSLGLLSPLRSTQVVRSLFAVTEVVPRRVVVPFRPCHQEDIGDIVYAVKRANARYRGKGRLTLLQAAPLRQRRTWGRFFTRELSETQERLRIPRTGRFDEPTWRALAPWFDAFAIGLVQPEPVPTRERLQMGWLSAFYNRRWDKNYTQKRPSELGPADDVDDSDCSGMVAASCDYAGILRKVDWRWTNTDVQILFGKPVDSLRQAQVLDVVLYGHGSDPNHEAIIVSLNPVIVQSFGSEPVRLLPVDYDRDGRGQRIAIRRFL